MPSRINIGPENGPYVAINESSGNLQLEDNSGNVVAEWDETNSQWDFANNTLNNVDALDSNSVNTEFVTNKPTFEQGLLASAELFSALGADTTSVISETQTEAGNRVVQNRAKRTDPVGTTSQSILNVLGNVAVVYISGEDTSTSSNNFLDIVFFSNFQSTKIIDSFENGTVPDRSYAVDGNDLELAMSADEYTIAAESRTYQPR